MTTCGKNAYSSLIIIIIIRAIKKSHVKVVKVLNLIEKKPRLKSWSCDLVHIKTSRLWTVGIFPRDLNRNIPNFNQFSKANILISHLHKLWSSFSLKYVGKVAFPNSMLLAGVAFRFYVLRNVMLWYGGFSFFFHLNFWLDL